MKEFACFELLLTAGLSGVCDGQLRSSEDPLLEQVAMGIRTSEGRRTLRAAVWFGVDLQAERKPKASQARNPDPVKTINAVVQKLGGVQLTDRKQVNGSRVRLYGWQLPS